MSINENLKEQMDEIENELSEVRKENEQLRDELGKIKEKVESGSGIPKNKNTREYIDKRIQKWIEGNIEAVLNGYLETAGLDGLDDDLRSLSGRVDDIGQSLEELRGIDGRVETNREELRNALKLIKDE